MSGITVVCGVCSGPLPPEVWAREEGGVCLGCRNHVRVKVFPALTRARPGERTAAQSGAQAASPVVAQADDHSTGPVPTLAAQTDASCFFHQQNRAERPCDECGRFLCKLCEIEISGKVLCSICFNAGLGKGKMQQIESSRTLHDSIALSLAIIPGLMIWPIVISAPLSIYWTVRHWNSPRSVLPRTRVRFYFAVGIALCQLAFVGVLIYSLVANS